MRWSSARRMPLRRRRCARRIRNRCQGSTSMQTNLETLGALQRRANVSVPLEKIEAEIHKRLSRLARTAKIAGFRPGKVPLKLIEKQYGPQVRSEVLNDAIN